MCPATAVQVIVPGNDHSFTLNESALKKILLDRKVKNNKVIVLSIVGAYRTGKSFLLNFILRHLYSKEPKNSNSVPDALLKGFDWKGGAERNTTGILIWGDPFEVNLPNGEKACVLLMDTQGAFDCQATVNECGVIFALSMLLSSVLVYNIKCNIQENDLHHLQCFADYGRLALEKSQWKPYQDLLFLVRDWQYPYDNEYGWKGGEKLIRKLLQTTGEPHQQLLEPRQYLEAFFARMRCCLLPHPGKKVAACKDFDGRLPDIDDEFKEHVEEFVSSLLSPENFVLKKINGIEITGATLFERFKAFVKTFQGNGLPVLQTIYEANVDANNSAAVEKAKDHYTKFMDSVCGVNRRYVWASTLQQKHDRCKQEAVQLFQSIPKMGNEEKSRVSQGRLEEQIDALFATYKERNLEKKPCKKGCCKKLLCCC